MDNKPAHPTAGNVSILIRASIPAVDGLFVVLKILSGELVDVGQSLFGVADAPGDFLPAVAVIALIVEQDFSGLDQLSDHVGSVPRLV